MTVAGLDAAGILSIPDDRPGFLFSGDPELIRAEHIALVKLWHPDRNKDPLAGDVMGKVTRLRDAAERAASNGATWVGREAISVPGADNRRRTIRYRRIFKTDVGETAYGLGVVAHFVRSEHAGLFADGLRTVGSLKYPADKPDIEKFMPKVRASFEARDGTMVMVVAKTPDVFTLRDVIAAAGGRIEPRHVAWIINSALNLACYLERVGFTHNAWSVDSYFISPKYHAGSLLGDWWYAQREGGRLTYVPRSSHQLMPPAMRVASNKLDLALIRQLGRAALGDNSTGMGLLADKVVPRQIVEWLRGAPERTAVDDYRSWGEALASAYGKRKFIKWELDADQVFATGGTS